MKTKLAKSEVVQRMAENEALIAMGAKQNFESILNIAMGLNGMVELAKEVGWKALGYQNQEDYTVTPRAMLEKFRTALIAKQKRER